MPARKRPGRGRVTRASPARSRAAEVVRRLLRTYPPGHPARPSGPTRDPLSELVFTVLSLNMSDVNRDRAWAALRAEFPRWADVATAAPARLAKAIAPGGLSNIKAPRIQAIPRRTGHDRVVDGRLDLVAVRRRLGSRRGRGDLGWSRRLLPLVADHTLVHRSLPFSDGW